MGILIDETFDLVTSVYKQAIREATGSNPELAQAAREWLDVVAPDWRVLQNAPRRKKAGAYRRGHRD